MTIKLISIFVFLSFTLSIFLFTNKLWSQETPQISVPIPMIFPLGEPNDAYAQYFTGKSYLKMLTTEGVNIANITFEPKCRNFWHIHHKGGQILLVTAGRGYYQEYGKDVQELHPGDVVNVKPGVKHWHGAAKDSWFSHLSVEIPAPGSSNEWLEPVSDDEYNKLK